MMWKRIRRPARLFLCAAYIAVLILLLFCLLTLRFTGSGTDTTVVYVMCGVISGSAAMMSVYGFSLYVQRPVDRYMLIFGLYCLSTALRVTVLEGGPIRLLFPAMSLPMLLLLRSVLTAAAGLSNFYLILELFGRRHVGKLRLAGTLLLVIPTVISNLFSFTGTSVDSLLGILGGVPVLLAGLVVVLRSGQMGRGITKLYAAATAFSLFSYSLSLLGIPNFAIVWNFCFLIVNTLLMADRYAKAFQSVERMNETLEQTVAERTAELREANEQLTEANEQITASQRQLKELVANISHDLKTPLTVVGLNLERLTDPEHPRGEEESRRMASVAYNKTLDLQRLTRNLFEAVRMEEGRVSYNPVWVSLSGLLGDVYRRYTDYTESAGVTLAARYGEDMELWIDPEKIWSVFDNVINNSLRYTGAGGSIIVSVERAGEGYAALTIADTGSGIGAEHLPHLFERYYKADPARGARSGDGGLGLYIVRTVVEGMEGSVRAASAPGEGTAITATLRAR